MNYGTSDSLYGPVQFRYPVLEKRPEEGILGTGHHCIMKMPGQDSWRIAYHRFALPLAEYPEGKVTTGKPALTVWNSMTTAL